MVQSKDIALNVIIVDDEKIACTNLSNIILHTLDETVIISGIAHNTNDAETLINTFHPDAIFLDINMCPENAFCFLDRIYPFSFDVVFVTAYDDYAVQAFKLNAVDYILKPIDVSEVSNAIYKLKNRKISRQYTAINQHRYRLLAEHVNKKSEQNKLVLKDTSEIDVVDFKSVFFIEAKGSYSKIYFKKNNIERSMVTCHSISEYEELLPTTIFYRIHKSYLVNCIYIDKVLKGDLSVSINSKFILPVGRRRYVAMIQFLKENCFK